MVFSNGARSVWRGKIERQFVRIILNVVYGGSDKSHLFFPTKVTLHRAPEWYAMIFQGVYSAFPYNQYRGLRGARYLVCPSDPINKKARVTAAKLTEDFF